jgi:organic radical activating enzyme
MPSPGDEQPTTNNQLALRVTEIFLSIQGESSHAGRPCSFVRLTGCPMRCVWCDSEYTFYGGEHVLFGDIFAKLGEFGCPLVEVTGGAPIAESVAKSGLGVRFGLQLHKYIWGSDVRGV